MNTFVVFETLGSAYLLVANLWDSVSIEKKLKPSLAQANHLNSGFQSKVASKAKYLLAEVGTNEERH